MVVQARVNGLNVSSSTVVLWMPLKHRDIEFIADLCDGEVFPGDCPFSGNGCQRPTLFLTHASGYIRTFSIICDQSKYASS